MKKYTSKTVSIFQEYEHTFDKMEGFKSKNCMSGYDFELWIQGLLISMRFNAKTTSGNDNSVDIIATYDK